MPIHEYKHPVCKETNTKKKYEISHIHGYKMEGDNPTILTYWAPHLLKPCDIPKDLQQTSIIILLDYF